MRRYLLYMFLALASISHGQHLLWEKVLPISQDIEKIIEHESGFVAIAKKGDSSVVSVFDSSFFLTQSWRSNFDFHSVASHNGYLTLSFLNSGNTGVVLLDSAFNVQDDISFVDGRAEHPQLLSWQDYLLLIDNFEYVPGSLFPRITRCSVKNGQVEVDSSFTLPRDFEQHQYDDAVIGADDDLYIVGTKQKFQQAFDLQQSMIRIDTLLDFEAAMEIGDESNNWVSSEFHSVTSFPSGIISAGLSESLDSNYVNLAIQDWDGNLFSNHLIHSSQDLRITNESIAYHAISQSVFLLINSSGESYLLNSDLNGEILNQFVMDSSYDGLFLIGDHLYVYGGNSIALISLDPSTQAGACELRASNNFASFKMDWPQDDYSSDNYFGGDPVISDIGSIALEAAENAVSTLCPEIELIGELEGCRKDSITLSIEGDEVKFWLAEDDTLTNNQSVTLPVSPIMQYSVVGVYGHEVVFQPILSDDPACSLIPEVYEYISPNGDNENDFFKIKNLEYYSPRSVVIVDANNTVVYENAEYDNSWSPVDVSDGVYFYHVTMGDFHFQGQLVIRK